MKVTTYKGHLPPLQEKIIFPTVVLSFYFDLSRKPLTLLLGKAVYRQIEVKNECNMML